MKALKNEILVSSYSPNNLLKQTKKKLRSNGAIQRTNEGAIKFQQGRTARGSLHKDTFYGRIKKDGEEKTVVRVPLAYSSSGGLFGFKSLDDFNRIVDPAVRDKVVDAFKLRCEGEAKFVDAFKEPVWMNEAKGIPVKKVRCFVGSVRNPLPLKKHVNLSKHAYKQSYLVVPDESHAIAIFEGVASNGRMKRTYDVFNKYEASRNGSELPSKGAVKSGDGIEYHLVNSFVVGDVVLLCDELPDKQVESLNRRLYKVFGIEADGRVKIRFHSEARKDEEQGREVSIFDPENPPAKLRLSASKFNVLKDGVDFSLNVLGEVEFMESGAC